jgi:hypothetical protein
LHAFDRDKASLEIGGIDQMSARIGIVSVCIRQVNRAIDLVAS